MDIIYQDIFLYIDYPLYNKATQVADAPSRDGELAENVDRVENLAK